MRERDRESERESRNGNWVKGLPEWHAASLLQRDFLCLGSCPGQWTTSASWTGRRVERGTGNVVRVALVRDDKPLDVKHILKPCAVRLFPTSARNCSQIEFVNRAKCFEL